MDKDAYIAELEAELDAAKAKYNTIYESVRSVDRVVNDFKRHHKRTYDFIRDSYKKIQNRKASPDLSGTVTHPAGKKTPLAKIYTNSRIKRLNLVLDELDYHDSSTIEKLVNATKFAVKKHYELRIITRNNQPNPKLYRDFLADRNLPVPEKYSFYTDVGTRLASPIHRLDISMCDEFYDDLGEVRHV